MVTHPSTNIAQWQLHTLGCCDALCSHKMLCLTSPHGKDDQASPEGIGKVGCLYFIAPNEKMNSAMYHMLRKHLKGSFRMTMCSILLQVEPPFHTAYSIKKWFVENNVNVLDWIRQLVEMNQIQNCWSKIGWIISNMPPPAPTWTWLEEDQQRRVRTWPCLRTQYPGGSRPMGGCDQVVHVLYINQLFTL